MLRYGLIHPPLLAAIGACGHGSRVLLADGNYPALTARPTTARLVHLNLAPGLLTVDQVLEALLTAVVVESATVMVPPDGEELPAHADYRTALGADVPVETVQRAPFYELVRSPDVGVVVATADQRPFANLLLTLGVRPA